MIRTLLLHSQANIALGASDLRSAFPSVSLGVSTTPPPRGTAIDADAWEREAALDFSSFDERGEAAARSGIVWIVGRNQRLLEQVGLQVMTRFQRHVARRNASSSTPWFDRMLAAQERLYTEAHQGRGAALDTWHWVLRLMPEANTRLQVAALFHDAGITCEIPAGEQTADEVRAGDASAWRSAAAAAGVLAREGAERRTVERISQLISLRTRSNTDPDGMCLAMAESLSFFSLGSADHLDRFGPVRTKRKIGEMLARLGFARPLLRTVKLRADVRALMAEVISSQRHEGIPA